MTIAQDGDSAVASEREITVGKATAVYARLLGEAVS